MIYCKLGTDSDVFMYEEDHGFVCGTCRLRKNGDDVVMSSPREALEHLEKHAHQTHPNTRHKVPQYAINRLRRQTYGTYAYVWYWNPVHQTEYNLGYEHDSEIPYDEVFDIAEEIANTGLNVMIVHGVAKDGKLTRGVWVDDRQFQQR